MSGDAVTGDNFTLTVAEAHLQGETQSGASALDEVRPRGSAIM